MKSAFYGQFPNFVQFVREAGIVLAGNREMFSLSMLSAKVYLAKSNGQADVMTRYWACLDRCWFGWEKIYNLNIFFWLAWIVTVANHGCALTTKDRKATLWVMFPGEKISWLELVIAVLMTFLYGNFRAIFRTAATAKSIEAVQKKLSGPKCAHIANICRDPERPGAIKELFRPFLAFCDQMGWNVLLDEVYDKDDEECVRVFEIYQSLGFELRGYHNPGQGLPNDVYCYMVREPQPQT